MEETNQNQLTTQQIVLPTKPQSLLVIFFSVLLTAIIVGTLVYWWQNKIVKNMQTRNEKVVSQLQTQINDLQSQLSQVSPTASTTPDIQPNSTIPKSDKIVDWQTHTDYATAYSIKYPKDWRKVDFGGGSIGVGPQEIGEDIKWGVWVYDSSATTIDRLISEIGNQFADRNEKREEVVIYAGGENIKATKVTVTISQLSDWYSVNIIFEHYGKIFNIGNGAIKDSDFELFYSSFTRLG